MSGRSPAPPASRQGRWLAVAFGVALASFTFLCWRDVSRSPARPVAGGTFVGRDVDGRLVYLNLFELDDADSRSSGWQGWLYREGQGRAEWFTTETRPHPWKQTFHGRERDDAKSPPESTVTSTDNSHQINVALPRLNSWGSDTANLTRQFEHVSFRRLAGLRLGHWGGTKEFRAQFPKLPDGSEFHAAIGREIVRQCEAATEEFTTEPLEFWRENLRFRQPMLMNTHELNAHWQLRLLTTNLASFCVWSYDEVGGNGNHSHWRGANFLATERGLRELELAELLRPEVNWRAELRQRCVPKLAAGGAPGRAQGAVTDADTCVDAFTLSPTGLQIYFNPYAIASGADGEFVVHFDYAELKDLLRDDGPARWLPRGK